MFTTAMVVIVLVSITYLVIGLFVTRYLAALFSNTFDALNTSGWFMKIIIVFLQVLCVLFWPLAIVFVRAVGFM